MTLVTFQLINCTPVSSVNIADEIPNLIIHCSYTIILLFPSSKYAFHVFFSIRIQCKTDAHFESHFGCGPVIAWLGQQSATTEFLKVLKQHEVI